jgi:hypothetical protein
VDAPPLFTDPFMLVYMHVMTLHGLTGYAGAVGTSVRTDQIHYYSKCNIDSGVGNWVRSGMSLKRN